MVSFLANSIGDDIEVYNPDGSIRTVFHNIREQQEKTGKEHYYCLSDFVAPKESGGRLYRRSAVAAGHGMEKWVEAFEKDNDDYSAILLKALADRLAEALAELLHFRVKRILGICTRGGV